MMQQNFDTLIHAIERWAGEEVERLVYTGTRPVSSCATVEAATREAAIAQGNRMMHSAEIAEIESVTTFVSQCVQVAFLHRSP
jgi:hypothetical protein